MPVNQDKWYEFEGVSDLDTPSVIFYENRILYNIAELLNWVNGDTARLRPHIKTFKCRNILDLYKKNDILKVKSATIRETQLAAESGIPDVLMSYQLNNQKINRFIDLIHTYPHTRFSTIIDNYETAFAIHQKAKAHNCTIDYFVDVNVGMNRTGFSDLQGLEQFMDTLTPLNHLKFRGFHAYDGHLTGFDWLERTKKCVENYNILHQIIGKRPDFAHLEIVAGGSNTFPYYAKMTNAVCSPGTFVLWDDNYSIHLPEQSFLSAALLVAQVVSIPQKNTICIDIGYKAVSSENSLDKRLRVLNYDNLVPIAHSEEHLVLQHPENINIPIGTVIYALPYHICPTVALYNKAFVVNQHKLVAEWEITNSR